jgi:chromate transport protein ChrA
MVGGALGVLAVRLFNHLPYLVVFFITLYSMFTLDPKPGYEWAFYGVLSLIAALVAALWLYMARQHDKGRY